MQGNFRAFLTIVKNDFKSITHTGAGHDTRDCNIEANLISSYDVIKSSLPKFVVNISNWRELNLIFTSGDIYTVVAFFKASPEKLWFMQLNWKKYGE